MGLFAFELRRAAIIARTLVPRDALGGTTADVDLPRLFAADCLTSPWQANLVLRLAIWLTWLSPLWMHGHLRSFAALDEPGRVAQLEELLASRVHLIRLTMMYLKLLACSFLLGNERVLGHLGAYHLPALTSLTAGAAPSAAPSAAPNIAAVDR